MPDLLQGKIASAASGGLVAVVITAFDSDQAFTGCIVAAGATPTLGQRCLVAFDDQGDAWVIALG